MMSLVVVLVQLCVLGENNERGIGVRWGGEDRWGGWWWWWWWVEVGKNKLTPKRKRNRSRERNCTSALNRILDRLTVYAEA